ncbi:MAG: GAF domain-containing protein, partial [Anaerolineae bacterium]|nr:GAF domain-containing protein [Anaerolineae bacterium]
SRQPLVIPDVLKDPRWEQREDTLHVRSWLVAPMVMGETVIGIMTADHARPGVYDEETGGLVSAVAAQAAIAVQNARLYEESQQRALEQEGLARIAALAGSSLALDELVDGVMHEARQLLNAQSCAIMLEDEQGKALVGRYVSIRDVTIPLPEEWRVPKDAPGFEYSIFARGGDYFTNQGVDDPNVIPAYKPYMESLGVKNFCGVAIRVRERSVGEMYLLNREEGFSRHEAQVLRTIASYIGNAIENARLFQEAERREQQALALYEAGQLAGGLGGQLDMQSFFEHLSSVGNYDRWWVTTFNEDKTVMTGIAGRWEGVEDTDMHRDVVLADEPNNPVVIAVQRRETVTVSDPDNDPRLADLPEHIRRAAGKYVTEPLVMGDEVIGAISIGRPADSRDISPEDIGLARTLSTQVALTITNVRLFQQTEAALVETDALYTIGQAISRLVGLQDMLTKLAQVLVEQLGYASSWIALVDQDNRVLRGVTGAGAHVTERIIATQAPLDPAARNPSVQAAITGETMVLNDVPKDERAADLTAGARATLGRLLVTPIVTAGRTLGIISVSRPLDVPAFVQRDIDMIAAVADQAAIAVQNVRLLEETQQRVQELAMLFRASEALAGAPLRPEQIAEITARQFVEIMGVPEASVSLYDPDADMLYVLADLFVEGDELRYEDSDEYNFPLSGFPATRRVMESLQPMIIQSSDPNADAAELAYMEGLGVKTLVIIPLAVKGASIGVIELESLEEERRYPDDLLNLAMTLANQAAIALENARLFEQTQQRAERERLITEITGKIRASTNLETILQTAAQELGRALGTSRVVVRVGIEPEAVGDS